MTIGKVKSLILNNGFVRVHQARRTMNRLAAEAANPDEFVETAAMALHDARHPAGYAAACGECREYSRIVTRVMEKQIAFDAERGWMAARDWYGSTDSDGVAHGAECFAHRGHMCTCNTEAQREAFREWFG